MPYVPDPAPHPTAPILAQRRRNRGVLLLLAAVFLGTFLVAGVLRFAGWKPQGLKNRGELLEPAASLRHIHPQPADGSAYVWPSAERHWRILVVPPAGCTHACDVLAGQLDKVWQLTGHRADHVEIWWAGPVPALAPAGSHQRRLGPETALAAALPRPVDARGPVTYLVDPNGFAVLRYAAGFDPGDLRTDLSKLLRLQ